MTSPIAIDLFCGCGGISAGLREAGYDILAGADIEKHYIQTYRRNFPETRVIETDLSKLDPGDLMKSLYLKAGDLDLLAGGPPCQGFSKNVPRNKRFHSLKSNLLICTFLDYCEHFMPKIIMMENVAEMKNGFNQSYTLEISDRLKKIGYNVDHSILNAADFGVPQRRRRAFFLAVRDNVKFNFPRPTHMPRGSDPLFPLVTEQREHVSVWEAIGDLPSLEHGGGSEPCEYGVPPNGHYQCQMRNPCGMVMNHVARKLKPTQAARLASLGPGEGHNDLPRHLQTNGGYSGAYGRLTKEMIAPTITRWVFHPGSGRFGHPVDVRTITMRETARIQGFKDSFVFVGSYTQQAGQLGNAVPPLLIKKIARELPV